jgi:phosphoglycerate dehydrogenase-like enzyme
MTLGLVGYGNIGRSVHRLVGPFDVKVLVFDPFYNGPAETCELVDSLDDLCARSDAVSVHVPLSKSTRGMITRRELALIGPNGLVINAARGGIVDETDLLDALVEGDLGGAAVDCFASEPPDADYVAALVGTRRALLTPHVAGVSVEALATLCGHAVNGIAGVLGLAADWLPRGVPSGAVASGSVRERRLQ